MVYHNSKVAIVAGGNLDRSLLQQIKNNDFIIGVDHGAYWLLEQKIVPDVAIGDFDSVTEKEFQRIQKKVKKIVRHSPEKDATDLELAVEYAVTLKPKEVAIFGAIGTRFDHSFAGIQVLLKLSSHNIYGYIVDNYNTISIVRRKIDLTLSLFKYVSVFPLTEKAIVSLVGYRYNISHHEFVCGSTLGVSNEILNSKARIVVHSGTVLLVRSRD